MLIVDNNRRTRRWLLFSICAVSLVVTTLIPAHPMVQAGNPSDSLKLAIAVEKTNVVLGEPVYVTVRLRNTEFDRKASFFRWIGSWYLATTVYLPGR